TDNTPHTAAAASPSNEAAAAQAAAAKALEAELDQIEKELDQLTSRAGAVNSSLDNLKNQQGSMGLGLRGDMAAKQSSMKNNLAKAQDAISRNDAERAKRYTGLAEKDIEALEKFLGR
ncbi:MAG TPA: hypothetical protein VN577_03520, partial [Terriglobales bacterium]|nr:hypothetical protein [Terriglobales bacterium]